MSTAFTGININKPLNRVKSPEHSGWTWFLTTNHRCKTTVSFFIHCCCCRQKLLPFVQLNNNTSRVCWLWELLRVQPIGTSRKVFHPRIFSTTLETRRLFEWRKCVRVPSFPKKVWSVAVAEVDIVVQSRKHKKKKHKYIQTYADVCICVYTYAWANSS